MSGRTESFTGAREHSCFFPPQLERWQQRQWAIIYLFKVEDTRRLCDGGGALHQDNLGNCSLVTIYHGLSPGHRHLHNTNTGNHRVRSGESIWTLNLVHSCGTLRPVSLLFSIIVDSHCALGGWQVLVRWVRSWTPSKKTCKTNKTVPLPLPPPAPSQTWLNHMMDWDWSHWSGTEHFQSDQLTASCFSWGGAEIKSHP